MSQLREAVRQYILECFGEKCGEYERCCPICHAYQGLEAIFDWEEDLSLLRNQIITEEIDKKFPVVDTNRNPKRLIMDDNDE